MRVRLSQRWRKEIAARLRYFRKASGYTQVCLAHKMGVRLETVCKIEQGKHAPDLATLLLWCAACKCSAHFICEGLY